MSALLQLSSSFKSFIKINTCCAGLLLNPEQIRLVYLKHLAAWIVYMKSGTFWLSQKQFLGHADILQIKPGNYSAKQGYIATFSAGMKNYADGDLFDFNLALSTIKDQRWATTTIFLIKRNLQLNHCCFCKVEAWFLWHLSVSPSYDKTSDLEDWDLIKHTLSSTPIGRITAIASNNQTYWFDNKIDNGFNKDFDCSFMTFITTGHVQVLSPDRFELIVKSKYHFWSIENLGIL